MILLAQHKVAIFFCFNHFHVLFNENGNALQTSEDVPIASYTTPVRLTWRNEKDWSEYAFSEISLFEMFEHLRKIPAKDKNILLFSEASNAWRSKITGLFSKRAG